MATICGLLAYWALRRMNRPLDRLLRTLAESAGAAPKPAPAEAMAGADEQVRALYLAYNDLIESVRERERLRDELAEQEQAAALGRLSATVAHEIRNPLGGLATAVSTLKRFGDDPTVRAESLGFLERGIEALDKIVTSTLNLYRPEDERHLTPADFADLKRLAGPAAERAGVRLEWSVDLPETLSVAATGARQVFLNLLLNACAVTPRNGEVSLRAFLAEDALKCVIRDQGDGMASGHADRLSGAAPAAGAGKRLGIDVIVGLLDRLEGRASVQAWPDGGTEVTISIPVEAADV
ncbi:MAG: HAMP domain-containing sensor histidine kinase [Alphaproteobacteria bacterium]